MPYHILIIYNFGKVGSPYCQLFFVEFSSSNLFCRLFIANFSLSNLFLSTFHFRIFFCGVFIVDSFCRLFIADSGINFTVRFRDDAPSDDQILHPLFERIRGLHCSFVLSQLCFVLPHWCFRHAVYWAKKWVETFERNGNK